MLRPFAWKHNNVGTCCVQFGHCEIGQNFRPMQTDATLLVKHPQQHETVLLRLFAGALKFWRLFEGKEFHWSFYTSTTNIPITFQMGIWQVFCRYWTLLQALEPPFVLQLLQYYFTKIYKNFVTVDITVASVQLTKTLTVKQSYLILKTGTAIVNVLLNSF